MRRNFLPAVVVALVLPAPRLVVVVALFALTVHGAWGQPTVNFNNRVTGVVVAPIYGVEPRVEFLQLRGNATTNGGTVEYRGPLLAGTTYSAQLFYGPEGTSGGNLQPLGPVVQFRTVASLKGFVTPPPTAIPVPLPAGTRATFAVLAWDNGGNVNSTYADAIAATRAVGSSALFTPTNVLVNPPGTPIPLQGMTSFNLWVPACSGGFKIHRHPGNVVVPAGGTTSLSVELITCGSSPALQWRFNDSPISGATNNPLILSNITYAHAGNYDVVIHTPSALLGPQTETSRVAVVTIDASLLAITQQPASLVVSPGVTTNLFVGISTPGTNVTYQWRLNTANIPGATNNPLVFASVAHADAGNYDVLVTAYGPGGTQSLLSHTALLTVRPSILGIEMGFYEPFGVSLARLTYGATPNMTVHIEAKTTPPGLLWQEIGAASSPSNTGYFFDIFATNQMRMYRLRQ